MNYSLTLTVDDSIIIWSHNNVYFNEKDVYEAEEILIEGDNDIITNSNIPQPSTSSQPIKNTKISPIEPETAVENVPDNPDTNIPNPPITPHQKPTRQKSLEGLQQFNITEFGRGK